jgi:hypothetical protein
MPQDARDPIRPMASHGPAVGEDVTALMEPTDERSVGADVSSLMEDASTGDRSTLDTFLQYSGLKGLKQVAYGDEGENLPGTMASLAGLATIPMTGGMSLVPAALTAAGTSAVAGGGTRGLQRLSQGASVEDAAADAGVEGLKQGAVSLVAPALGAGLKRIAPTLMRTALGAQKTVRDAFPNIDLDALALREGVIVNKGGLERIKGLASEAHQAVPAAGRAADAAGVAPIQPRELVTKVQRLGGPSSTRELFTRKTQARMPEDVADVVSMANKLRKDYRGGINMEDALVAKSEWQNRAKSVLGASDPRAADTGGKIADAVQSDFTRLVRGRDEGIANALNRSQEMMALEEALKDATNRTPLLRALLGISSGVGAGAGSGSSLRGAIAALATLGLTSPTGLSSVAQIGAHGADEIAAAARVLGPKVLEALIGGSTPPQER